MVLVWMTHEVSPFCQYSDLVVMVRVTLQELSPNAAPNAVSAAISTEITIFQMFLFFIIVKVCYVHGLPEYPFVACRD